MKEKTFQLWIAEYKLHTYDLILSKFPSLKTNGMSNWINMFSFLSIIHRYKIENAEQASVFS